MDRKDIIDLIFHISKEKNAFEVIEKRLMKVADAKIPKLLLECGVMPELFDHDSGEEKLWAKYSDILLARGLSLLGLKSQVIRTRGNSADVLAESANYKIIGDAKTFRLSRTAKNQKDFKIESLDSWRRENDYAVLVGPQNQFPSTSSAIYQQAVKKNVTLLSYAHLYFLTGNHNKNFDWEPIWNVGYSLCHSTDKLRSAKNYWEAVDSIVVEICDKKPQDFDKVKKLDGATTAKLGTEGIKYWEDKIREYRSLSKEEAISRLLKSEKIESKITQIKRAISGVATE